MSSTQEPQQLMNVRLVFIEMIIYGVTQSLWSLFTRSSYAESCLQPEKWREMNSTQA